jgi:RNA polymerase sigma factor (sigma-70 family)
MGDAADVGELVRASAGGSEAAWNELVRRYSPLVLAVTRGYQLTTEDARDVSQTVWLRLVENLASLRVPEALPGWLATTTHRECLQRVRRDRQVVPVDPQADGALQQSGALRQGAAADHDAGLLRAELRQALRDGLAELPERDQLLLRLRVADPPKSYGEISRILGMPVGSIGPTLRRSLDKLRETRAMRAYLAAAAGEGQGGDSRELAQVE